MKFSVIFLVVCFIFGLHLISIPQAQAKNATSHTVIWGTRIKGDTYLYREVITRDANVFSKASTEFVWNQKNIPHPKIITQVSATDQYQDGKGGYATLVGGGPSFNHVKIHMESQVFRGFSFIVDIYGR